MVDVHRNPFDLLSDDGEEVKQTKKKQPKESNQRKQVVFPGDLSGKKKKGTAPQPAKSFTKDFTKPLDKTPTPGAKSESTPKATVAKAAPAPAPTPGSLVLVDVKATRASVNGLISALDEVLGSHTVLFKLQISSSSNDYYHKLLKEKPYQAISELIKTDKFNEGLLGSLRAKWGAVYEKSTDLRSKPLSIRVDKKLSKLEFVEKLVSLLTWQGRKKNKTIIDASHLVYDLLDPIFSVKAEDNKYISRLEEQLASEVGSQGNLKSGGTTLADFIVAPKKQNKKKKGKKEPQEEEKKEEKKEEQSKVPSTKEEITSTTEEVDFDPIYNVETIAKSIPFGWQFGVLTKTFLRKKSSEGETNEQGGKEWYFIGANEEIDNAIVFWNNTDVVFIFTTGSE